VRRGLAWTGLVVLVALVPACRGPSGPAAGADSSEQAVVQFLNGARADDLQAISAVWGNADSPTRERVDRQELERRLLIMVCHLRHDESRVGVAQRAEAGRTMHMVDLVADGNTVALPFTTVQNARSGRWFVENVDLQPARDRCRAGAANRPRRR